MLLVPKSQFYWGTTISYVCFLDKKSQTKTADEEVKTKHKTMSFFVFRFRTPQKCGSRLDGVTVSENDPIFQDEVASFCKLKIT